MYDEPVDEEGPRKRFQMNTSTPRFSGDEKCDDELETPSSVGTSEMDVEYRSEIDEAAPDALPMRYLSSKRFNTTSSVYASETIAAPDLNQILFW